MKKTFCILLFLAVGLFSGASPLYSASSVINGVYYGPPKSIIPSMAMDVYTPTAVTADTTTIVLIHGGGWSGGDKSGLSKVATALQAKGYIVANVNYRLTTALYNRYPTAINDVNAAVTYLTAKSSIYKINPNKIVGMGTSSGAQIALCLGEMKVFKAVIDFYGPNDLTDPVLLAGQKGLNAHYVAQYLGGTLTTIPLVYHNASPYLNLTGYSPPVFIYHGNLDTTVPIAQSQNLYNALSVLKITSTFHLIPNQKHDFLINVPSLAPYISMIATDLASVGY